MASRQAEVFQNEDLRRIIWSFLPKKCRSCKSKFTPTKNKSKGMFKKYWCSKWRQTQNKYHPNYCNWCCYYVFEHQI